MWDIKKNKNKIIRMIEKKEERNKNEIKYAIKN